MAIRNVIILFVARSYILNLVTNLGQTIFSVQHECIPQAILSMDVLCQAKSGMGKTAVFVLATLQQIEPQDGQVKLLIAIFFPELLYLKWTIKYSLLLPNARLK